MAPAPQQSADDADQHEPGVQVQAAGLYAAQSAGAALPSAASPFSVPSITLAVAQAQEHLVRDPDQRPADHALVQLVDEVLARQPAVKRRRSAVAIVRHRAGQRRTRSRTGQAASASATESRAAAVSKWCSASWTAGSGNCGSRKCGSAMKPPTADSAARTISTPGHGQRRLVHMVFDFLRHARAAHEREPQQPEHVERRHQRGRPRPTAGASHRACWRTRTRGSRPSRRSRPAAECRQSPRLRSRKSRT